MFERAITLTRKLLVGNFHGSLLRFSFKQDRWRNPTWIGSKDEKVVLVSNVLVVVLAGATVTVLHLRFRDIITLRSEQEREIIANTDSLECFTCVGCVTLLSANVCKPVYGTHEWVSVKAAWPHFHDTARARHSTIYRYIFFPNWPEGTFSFCCDLATEVIRLLLSTILSSCLRAFFSIVYYILLRSLSPLLSSYFVTPSRFTRYFRFKETFASSVSLSLPV